MTIAATLPHQPSHQSASKAPLGAFLARKPFGHPLTLEFFYREKMRTIRTITPDQAFHNLLEVGSGQGGLTALLYPNAQITNVDFNLSYAQRMF